jgi:thioesterase-3
VGEWVRIMSRLLWYNHNTVVLEYYMTDDSKKELKTVLWTTMRYVTIKEGKSTDHEGAILDFLKATSENLDISQMTIGERVKILKNKLLED